MEYMGGKEFWHQRFAARSDAPMQPEAILVEDMKKMQTGPRLLDLACGDGRNALYLAQLGMQVEAVDFCPTALQRLDRFASRQNLCLHTKQMDLSDPNAVEQLGSYDLILCNHYRLSAAAADRLREHLLPGESFGSTALSAVRRIIRQSDPRTCCACRIMSRRAMRWKMPWSTPMHGSTAIFG